MDKYTASNGVTVETYTSALDGARYLRAHDLNLNITEASASRAGVDALREFFRAEEDARLGRWRWPENPDITVRTAPAHAQRAGSNGGTVMIQQESDGYVAYYDRSGLPELSDLSGGIVRAGHAYFDTHPEQSYTVAEWVAKAMYEGQAGVPWEEARLEDRDFWLGSAEAAIAKYEEIR